MNIKISPSDKRLIDLSSVTYEESQLLEISKFNGSINELNEQYPVECIRDISGSYRVSYIAKNDSIAVIHFDALGNRISGKIYKTQKIKSDFNELGIGQSLEKVKEIDPDGEYLFLYTGRNDTPKISTHYTKDNYLITIEYDAYNTIININEELI